MAGELTMFSTSTICAALSNALPMKPEIKADVLYTNKARGHWPIKEEGRGWTRYGLVDATRLLVQLELNRCRGVHIGIATAIAEAEHVDVLGLRDGRRDPDVDSAATVQLELHEETSRIDEAVPRPPRPSSLIGQWPRALFV